MANVVITPLVIIKDEEGKDAYFYQGAILPSWVKGDQLKRLKDEGFVGTPKAALAAAEEPGEEPQ